MFDNWTGLGSLCYTTNDEYYIVAIQNVNEVVINGWWNIGMLEDPLLEDIVQHSTSTIRLPNLDKIWIHLCGCWTLEENYQSSLLGNTLDWESKGMKCTNTWDKRASFQYLYLHMEMLDIYKLRLDDVPRRMTYNMVSRS